MIKGELIVRDGGDLLTVGYEDYEVELFGGADYEVCYTLYSDARQKLEAALAADGEKGTLSEMILAHFGGHMEKESFYAYCKDRDIETELFTWVSGG